MKPSSFTNALRALIPALALLTSARAGQVVMDFDHYAAPSALNTITSPVVEDGLRLTNPNNFYIFGPGSTRNTGHKALNQQFTGTVNTLTAVNGAPFTLVSMRLSPFSANSNSNVTFTGNVAGGGTVTVNFTTGTALAGVVRTFPSNFTNLASVTWTIDSSGANYHQFDDITVILKSDVIIPPAITVTESSGSATVGLSLSEAIPSSPLNINYTIGGGTALSGTDYTGATSGTLTIPAGQLRTSLTIPITNDTTVESLENFTITFSAGSGASGIAGFPPSATTTISIASEDGVTGFPGWMSAHGLTAAAANPDADPNGDGVSNIESWLCKINPAGPSPQAWLDRRAAFVFDASNRPALRFTVPAPFPSDVQMIFEETTAPSAWTEQARRTGWGVGSLWTGPGSTRAAESTSVTSKTVTCSGSQTRTQRPKAYLRMKYNYISGGGAS